MSLHAAPRHVKGFTMTNLEFLQSVYPGQAILRLEQAARTLCVTTQHARNQISKGKFPIPTFLEGGNRCVSILDIASYLDKIQGK